MNSKRSMWKLLLGVVGVGLLVTNCTVKTADDDCSPPGSKKTGCDCPGNTEGYQTCLDDGTYDACFCPTSNVGGGSNAGASSAGASTAGASTAGASNSTAGKGGASSEGGASSSAAGEGGSGEEAGAGGAAPVVYANCVECLNDRCAAEYAACDADPACISAELDGSGQYERVAACIDKERIKGVVKRDVARGCGVTIGANPAPSFDEWAPEGMAATTTALLNCMADAPGATAASWANDDANYPVDANDMIHPTPWPANTCAKDACTSGL
ncbi:MAG TPA: hypothetical protein VJV79_04905 [Polyangiaceae bacterium]|nr:hypothetical protein [Polyangiaceae bacterium]